MLRFFFWGDVIIIQGGAVSLSRGQWGKAGFFMIIFDLVNFLGEIKRIAG